jgi:hypothetical protein
MSDNKKNKTGRIHIACFINGNIIKNDTGKVTSENVNDEEKVKETMREIENEVKELSIHLNLTVNWNNGINWGPIIAFHDSRETMNHEEYLIFCLFVLTTILFIFITIIFAMNIKTRGKEKKR